MLQDSHLRKNAQHLEGPGDAAVGDFVRGQVGDVLAGEEHGAAGLRSVDARDEVEERTLARPVRPDDPVDRALRNLQLNIGQRNQAAEVLRESGELKQHPSSPSGLQ